MTYIDMITGRVSFMIHRPYDQLTEIGNEVVYLDPLTMDKCTGIVMMVEQLAPRTAFVYLASPYKDENIHQENGIAFRDIMVFDDVPNEDDCGVYRDHIIGQYGRFTGDSN
jgi:hypothetical protein